VTFTAVPVTIRSRYLTSRYSGENETRESRATIWFRETDDGWRIAKDPLSAGSEDASAPPDPYAAQHARQAEQRKEREQRAARRRTLVRLDPALSCPRGVLTLADDAHDPDVATRDSARRLSAGSDIVAATVALRDRRVCFSIRFRGRPLTGSERLGLSLFYALSNPSRRRYASFRIDNDFPTADGLHAGLLDPSRGTDVATPAQARVGTSGNTISASFTLPPSFPLSLRRGRLGQLGLTILTTARLRNGAAYVSDRAEAGRTPEKLAAAAAKAERARRAKEKAAEEARKAAAWAPALVRFDTGRVTCRGKPVSATDTASDVSLMDLGRTTRRQSPLRAFSDIRSATVAVSGRHVCFAVKLARQPFGRRQRRFGLQLGLSLTYRTKTAPYLRRTAFGVETNAELKDGRTYAGILMGGATAPRPANAHVELHGKTLSADFDLDSSFPPLRPAQLKALTWGVSFFGTDVASVAASRPLTSHDQLPNNPDRSGLSVSPEVRQSDGRIVRPY
jgi:hypothetical protein